MMVIEKSLDEIGKERGIPVVRCKKCGGIPVLKEEIDEHGYKQLEIKCDCGLYLVLSERNYNDIIDHWNRVNNHDCFIPKCEPFYAGVQKRCMTCLQKKICVNARRFADTESLCSFLCHEYIKE